MRVFTINNNAFVIGTPEDLKVSLALSGVTGDLEEIFAHLYKQESWCVEEGEIQSAIDDLQSALDTLRDMQ
tara:strand:+ start:233 stop:445 length:213 start_codon:yes stop_codon:yes gene_type:complete